MMDTKKALSAAIEAARDLYKDLGCTIDSVATLRSISLKQLRKNYRQIALRFHPDKQIAYKATDDRFVRAKEAFEILSDTYSRQNYNSWFESQFLTCAELQNSLVAANTCEHARQKDLQQFQEHSQLLRKLRHFKIPYGDWESINCLSRDTTHRFKDSCTLRIKMLKPLALNDTSKLRALFARASIPISSLRYSSSNNYEMVVYVTLLTVETTKELLKNWESKPELSEHIESISPYIEVSYFGFPH